ncbi:MAG: hypothetical protein ABH864_06990 [archaeon]
MTKAEYVRLSPPENDFGHKNLLSGQLELLRLIQSFHRFRILRDEELVLKVTLKGYIEATNKEIDRLERILPKAEYKEKGEEDDDDGGKLDKNRKLSLEEEIAKVRAKLSKLQGEI